MFGKWIKLVLLGLTLILIPASIAPAFDQGDPDLIGYWPLNEGSGTVAADLSPNGYDGTLNGGVTWTDGVSGCIGQNHRRDRGQGNG
ncbi:MAG: hypothetical protein P8Z79_08180 [Sedimentisphaerales bacterium]